MERLQPKDCIQLTSKDYTCASCPIYKLAQETLSVSSLNDRVVAELTSLCPEGAKMNIAGLGLDRLPVETPRLRRSGGFVR